jgi:hypothetical protein
MRLHVPGQVSHGARHYFHIFRKGRRKELDAKFDFRTCHDNHGASRRNLAAGFHKRWNRKVLPAEGTQETVVLLVDADNSNQILRHPGPVLRRSVR